MRITKVWGEVPYLTGIFEMWKENLKKFNVGVYSKATKTIQNCVSGGWNNKKDIINETGVVYAVPCVDCHQIYVGQTGRSLFERLKEHNKAVENEIMSNALARHKSVENHNLHFKNTKVVFREKNQKMRMFLESYCIAADAERKMNIAPPSSGMIGWIKYFKNTFLCLIYLF